MGIYEQNEHTEQDRRMEVDVELWDPVIAAVEEELPWTWYTPIITSCITDTNPLTVVLEYEHRNDGRLIVCAQRPWRTNTWLVINECEANC